MTDTWTPEYSPWRHGGWYVDNVRYASGAVGCVSRNYDDRKWRIVCDPRDFEEAPTFPNRDAAARAEKVLADATRVRTLTATTATLIVAGSHEVWTVTGRAECAECDWLMVDEAYPEAVERNAEYHAKHAAPLTGKENAA